MPYASPFTPYGGISRDFLEVNPRSAYDIWARYFGASAFNNPSYYNYAQGLYPAYEQDYYGQASQNLGLTWLDYLDKLGMGGGLGAAYQALSPRQRGERNAPTARWNIPR